MIVAQENKKEKRPPAADRSTARLFAVQALYQAAITGQSISSVIEEFLLHRFNAESLDLRIPEKEHFIRLVRGVPECTEVIDPMLAAHLSSDWSIERLPRLLLCVLRAGVFELMSCRDVPLRVVINEYVDLVHAFFDGKEPSFVNAVLDKLAQELRKDEITPPDGPQNPG